MAVLSKIKGAFSGQAEKSSAPSMQLSKAINKRAVVVGVLLLLAVIVMVVMFNIQGNLAQRNKIYTTIASEQQVISQQIAVNALEAAAGQNNAFDQLASNQNRFLILIGHTSN